LCDSISIYLGRHIYIVLYLCLITYFAVTIVLTPSVARALSSLEGRNLCSMVSHRHVPNLKNNFSKSVNNTGSKWSGTRERNQIQPTSWPRLAHSHFQMGPIHLHEISSMFCLPGRTRRNGSPASSTENPKSAPVTFPWPFYKTDPRRSTAIGCDGDGVNGVLICCRAQFPPL
jgi:hypothetical protein